MTIYISGPMSGLYDKNKKAFQEAQKEIAKIFKTNKAEKVKIINPIKLGYKLENKFAAADKEPLWTDYMRLCIKELCDADYVYLLKNWANSDGAIFEHHIANHLSIPCAENIRDLSKLILGGSK
jgi:predicted ATPase